MHLDLKTFAVELAFLSAWRCGYSLTQESEFFLAARAMELSYFKNVYPPEPYN